jgi:hypothetical protein
MDIWFNSFTLIPHFSILAISENCHKVSQSYTMLSSIITGYTYCIFLKGFMPEAV